MHSAKVEALAQANDFLRDYLADLESGETRSLDDYIRSRPGSEHLLPEIWEVLHAEAGCAAGSPHGVDEVARLTVVGRQIAEDPKTLTLLVERAFAEREAAAPEDLIAGYRLLEEIGRGGQGRVYRAHDDRLDREVAIKLLPAGAQTADLRRLRREGYLAARLDDPCICKAYEIGDCERGTYVVMQFFRGQTLALRIADSADAPIDLTTAPGERRELAVLRFVSRIARTLDRMHQAGVLHRDIKPGNVMVADDGRPVILDLGLARTNDDLTITRAGTLLGTLDYIAPELLADSDAVHDARTEVWSLGVVLFECLAGKRPFHAATRNGTLDAILKAPLPTEFLRAMPRDLRIVLETALDRDRDRRYQTSGAFAEDLERLIRREPVLARPIGPLLRARRAVQRRPVAAMALLCTIAFPSVWAVEAQAGERRATRYLSETLGTVQSLLVQLASVNLDDMPRGAQLRRQLLEEARTRYRRLSNDGFLTDEVEAGLVRVEVELARLALEQDLLEDASGYADRACQRLDRMLANNPSDADLRRLRTRANIRKVAILTRGGQSTEAERLSERTVDEIRRRNPSPANLTLLAESLLQLADVRHARGRVQEARQCLEEVIAIANGFEHPAHDAASLAWLLLAELHREKGDAEALDQALHESEVAAQHAFLRTPSDHFLTGIYGIHQLYRADQRSAEHARRRLRACLTRAKTLLSALNNAFPYWTQVDLMRWQFNTRNVDAFLLKGDLNLAEGVCKRALLDTDSFDEMLRRSRQHLLCATAMLYRLVEQLEAHIPTSKSLPSLRAKKRELTGRLLERGIAADSDAIARRAAWVTIMRLHRPIRPNAPAEVDPPPPSADVARAVSSGMRIIALRYSQGKEGRREALRLCEIAQRIMEQAYAQDPASRNCRFLYYAMDQRARHLIELGWWDKAVVLRKASLDYFFASVAHLNPKGAAETWRTCGPHLHCERLSSPKVDVSAKTRLRMARVLARTLLFLNDSNLSPDDGLPIGKEIAARGRAIVQAARRVGWSPQVAPEQDPLLGVLYR